MSHVDLSLHPELLSHLHLAEKDIDDLLNIETQSKPAVWERESQSLIRLHLEEDDSRLPEYKRQINVIKEAIKAKLIEDFGEYSWEARMPLDSPIDRGYNMPR